MPDHHILITVMNWGLGHATRSVPVIQTCLDNGVRVSIASDGMSLMLLREEFPQLESFTLPGYDITYNKGVFSYHALKLLQQVQRAKKAEHLCIAKLHTTHKFDAIITDNRYGSFVDEIPGAIITHQLRMIGPNAMANVLANWLIRRWLKPFDSIWVPDDAESSLSGGMSDLKDDRVQYVGWLSSVQVRKYSDRYVVACILSGPEPVRAMWESELKTQLANLNLPSVLVRGVSGTRIARTEGNVTTYDYLSRKGIHKLLQEADIIVCRPGYSSLMDLQSAGKKALLVPTPQQPEQEYLARHLSEKVHYVVQSQKRLNLKEAVDQLRGIQPPPPMAADSTALSSAIRGLVGI